MTTITTPPQPLRGEFELAPGRAVTHGGWT